MKTKACPFLQHQNKSEVLLNKEFTKDDQIKTRGCLAMMTIN
jgi:hypothetical protein